MDDNSPMPFGKYIGLPMQDVPAYYLLFLNDRIWFKQSICYPHVCVINYIKENLQVLQKQLNEK